MDCWSEIFWQDCLNSLPTDMSSVSLRRGRNRHTYLRKILGSVKCLWDLEHTFVPEVAHFLRSRFPLVNDNTSIIVRSEVSILNRRPDFVIVIPDCAVVLLEYKTTTSILGVRRAQIRQVADTFHNFKLCFSRSDNDSGEIELVSLLLIRHSRQMKNKLICVRSEKIANRQFWL